MTAGAIPWELYELVHRYTHIRLGVLLVNVAVVVYLAVVLAQKRRKRQAMVMLSAGRRFPQAAEAEQT